MVEPIDDLSPDLCAALDVQRATLLYSKHEGLRAVDVIGALTETLAVIDSMAEEYVERARKAGLN